MSVRIVVMGPSGCGKSTVGSALAESMGARFIDGDDLHPLTNVEKMAAGIPLDDADRMPWLRTVGATLHGEDRIVIACSALRRRYRDAIREEAPDTFFVELVVDRATLEARLTQRAEHFMPASLLDSQLETLESLQDGEAGVRVSASLALDEELRLIRDAVQASAL
ncbi:gluconokinase [Microbacterium sp. MYb45]|uniref:gluconokinase n=1 Tax=Microbacterium sp. MYb45 TaxID=1827294 RepID=UPI000CFE4942|nr:gluconokinase [Microbacterium sp. MYb45]PRB63129.1 gluconate kinase [Microbacterium sp. MYb45]